MKHEVRTKGWLPICLKRKKAVNSGKKPRRLRYFTFCAPGAIDVLMLDVEKIVRPSSAEQFDNVYFFDQTDDLVMKTKEHIPGAVGFPGDFIKVMNVDIQPPLGADQIQGKGAGKGDSLEPPAYEKDTAEVRAHQRLLSQRSSFERSFPFDIVNLDLEGYFFKRDDPFPGELVKALRKVFEWQRKPLTATKQPLDGFSLMFTTKVGPSDLKDDYLDLLRGTLQENCDRDAIVKAAFEKRTGRTDVAVLLKEDFELFFKLSMPKVLASALLEADWHVEADPGIQVFQFERPYSGGTYRMLHLVMSVKRNDPPIERRAPDQRPEATKVAYKEVVRKVIADPEVNITLETVDVGAQRPSLEIIKARRRKYSGETG